MHTKRSKYKLSFKKELIYWLIGLITALLIVLEVSNGIIFTKLTNIYLEKELQMARNTIMQTLIFQDRACALCERQLEPKLLYAMEVFQQKYLESDQRPDKINYKELKQLFNEEIDFFVINKEYTVESASFNDDIGLTITTSNSTFAGFLNDIRINGTYISDNLSISNFDGIKKFAYQGSPDKEYILEVGISASKYGDIFKDISFNEVSSQLINTSELIEEINIYDQYGRSFNLDAEGKYKKLTNSNLQALKLALERNEKQVIREGNKIYEYSVVPNTHDTQLEFTGKVVEVITNTNYWEKYGLVHFATQSTIIVAIAIILGLIGSLFLAKKVAEPVGQLVTSVSLIADGNLTVPVKVNSNNELSVLADSVEVMRKRLQNLIVNLTDKNREISSAYNNTIRALYRALEYREKGTASHSIRVNKIAMAIGKHMHLSDIEMQQLDRGTLLHDIGKLAISDAILLKEGPLTADEYDLIKKHPVIAFELFQGIDFLAETSEIPLYHHERYDGTGYPKGLSGEQIPLLARICSIADAFEAMTADRPYRKGKKTEEAITEIVRSSGTQFDPMVVQAFMECYRNRNGKTLTS